MNSDVGYGFSDPVGQSFYTWNDHWSLVSNFLRMPLDSSLNQVRTDRKYNTLEGTPLRHKEFRPRGPANLYN